MYNNPIPEKSMQPLSIGNVVNLSFYLYRAHLKLYLKLSLIAHLWLLVPFYGWAKFYSMSGLISRLVFCELSGKPESLNTAKNFIKPKLLNFLIANILVLMFLGVVMLLSLIMIFLALIILIVILVIFSYAVKYSYRDFLEFLGILIAMLLLVIVPLSGFWLYSRLFITDLLLATETNFHSFEAIKESWKLTKGLLNYTQGIMALIFLITLPVATVNIVLVGKLLTLIYYLLSPILPLSLGLNSNSGLSLSVLLINFITSVITLPLWQSAKTTLYYEIWKWRDAFNLKLQNRNL